MLEPDILKNRLIEQAKAEGFVACRICRPWDIPQVPERLRAFLGAGYHGQMGWMAERVEWRENPAALWPEAKSVIMLAESYTPDENPMDVVGLPDRAAISVYARGKDYHDLVKKRLKRLARWLIAETSDETPKETRAGQGRALTVDEGQPHDLARPAHVDEMVDAGAGTPAPDSLKPQ